VFEPSVRDGYRCIIDMPLLTAFIFNRIKHILPASYQGCSLSHLNPRCRFLYYTPGQSFSPHCDGMYVDKPTNSVSKLTIQLYFNTMNGMNDGGQTTFINDEQTRRLECEPVSGSALLFSQSNLFHEGSRVKRGWKYTMRTDVMYTRMDTTERLKQLME
jgi:prolyl 4-hydroxylase